MPVSSATYACFFRVTSWKQVELLARYACSHSTRKELSDKHEVVSDTARRLEDLCQKFELVKDKSFTVSVTEYKVEGVKALTPSG